MRRDRMPTFVLAAAILVGALVLAGVPLAGVLYPLALLACPLMMIFMMRGMNHTGGQGGGCHGGHSGHDGAQEHGGRRQEPTRPVDKDNVP